jgi:hypothetical protein
MIKRLARVLISVHYYVFYLTQGDTVLFRFFLIPLQFHSTSSHRCSARLKITSRDDSSLAFPIKKILVVTRPLNRTKKLDILNVLANYCKPIIFCF